MDRLAHLSLNLSPSPQEMEELLQRGLPLACDVETPRERSNVIELCGLASSPRHGLVFEWREPYIALMRRWL